VKALEAKVGVNGSMVVSSLDYMVTQNTSAIAANTAAIAALSGKAGAAYPPTGYGLKVWSGDPSLVQATAQLVASGRLHLTKFYVPEAMTISTLCVYWNGAGSGTSASYMALYTAAGALLSQSGSNGATTVGLDTFTLNAAQAVAAGYYYAGIWVTWSTTAPFIFCHGGPAVSSGFGNLNLAAPNLRFATADSGLTNTAPANFGAQTATQIGFWVGAN
jgi:hypothetical protein